MAEVVSALVKAYEAQVPINLSKIKGEIAKKHKLAYIPKLVDIIATIPANYKSKLLPYVKAKPIRTASGIAVVAVMSKPHRCPHIAMTGNVCVYCPGGPDSDFEYSTQAYTGYEPTSMRAIRARYHPFSQTRGRPTQKAWTQRGQGRVHRDGRHIHVPGLLVQGLFHPKPTRRPLGAPLEHCGGGHRDERAEQVSILNSACWFSSLWNWSLLLSVLTGVIVPSPCVGRSASASPSRPGQIIA